MQKLEKERVPMAEYALVNKVNELVDEVNKLKEPKPSFYVRAIAYTRSIFRL